MEELSDKISEDMEYIQYRNAILEEYKDLEWVQRILNPELNINPVFNDDGTISTHSMSAEVDEDGNWFVFPTIENTQDGMKRFLNEDGSPMDAQSVREHLKQSGGGMIPFGKDKDAAIKFSQNYKPQAFRDFYQK